MKEIPASYCIIIIHGTNTYIMKDKYGIRPLSYGYKGDTIYVSSETVGLKDCKNITEVKNGEILKISKNDIETLYKHKTTFNNFCSFEIIYFMHPNSYYHGLQIKELRKKLTHLLIQKEDIILYNDKDYIVVGVPNSGIIYGESFAEKLSLKYSQVIEKKTNERTFISINNNERVKACKKKFTYKKDDIKGKKIIILDDTIVRGNVIKTIIENIKKYNPLEIHIRIPSPPVIDRCQLGIAIRSKEELLMNNRNLDEVTKILGVNSIRFLHLDDINKVIPNCYCEFFGGGIPPDIINYCSIEKEDKKEEKKMV